MNKMIILHTFPKGVLKRHPINTFRLKAKKKKIKIHDLFFLFPAFFFLVKTQTLHHLKCYLTANTQVVIQVRNDSSG